ncbi:toll/interleukin-1 receptor domain-containing protein [Prosthecobacter sp.]|uniref:toll/interleukin-1 receptor domain-containing protein n=1 Tax=Prosthecobacter sp. TaxID=1965333 RepID=UPI002AB9E68E|nr:toll/interleukin-1 receptor domain-containing protein [Prosthecobacter sp.]MDZ4404568.1 toll/interleukin-1 receptor domain-containing protein [Prosthecobacter sp.]
MPDDFRYDVFLSHSAKDKPIVRDIAERLKKDGLKVWFDEWEIKPGDSIPSKIDAGLEYSRVLALFMSANAFGSDWAALESYSLRFRDPLNKDGRFIPVKLDDAPIKTSLAQFLYIDWSGRDNDHAYSQLLTACRAIGNTVRDEKGAGTSTTDKGSRILIDEGHQQIKWVGYPTAGKGYSSVFNSLNDVVVKSTTAGTSFSSSLLNQSDVLLMPMPFGTIVNPDEYEAIAQWVYAGHGLMILGNYLMEGHHHTNFNHLARIFSLEFSQDLVMPCDREDFRSCVGQAFGTRPELQTSFEVIAKPVDHPLVTGVKRLALQSSCTVLSRSDVDITAFSQQSLSVMKAVGPKDGSGKIQQIQDYVLDKRAPVCFAAGTSHGRGRVLAVGSWKTFLNEFTENPALDNGRLFQNAIAWLTPTK